MRSEQGQRPLSDNLIEDLAAFERRRNNAISTLDTHGDALASADLLTQACDALLVAQWEHCVSPDLRQEMTLFAVGGYGRRHLCFWSDLDILIEVYDDVLLQDARTQQELEAWIMACRQSQMKIAHAVRTPAQGRDELTKDWRTPIALLDARALAGEARPESVSAHAAREMLRADDEGATFVTSLLSTVQQRRERGNQTVYLLEPDLKSGHGALRDLNCLHWASTVRFGSSADALDAQEHGWTQQQRALYHDALSWLLRLRQLNHLESTRKHDQLRFPDQERIAAKLYPGAKTPAETLMRSHYRITRAIARQLTQSLTRWSQADDAPVEELGGRWRRDAAGALESSEPLSTPADVFDALEASSEHAMSLSPALELELVDVVSAWPASILDDATCQQRLLSALSAPDTPADLSTKLLETGVLARLLPEFAPLICHVQHDVYHVYTTDVHSLKCMERARALLEGKPDPICARWPMFSRIAAHVTDHQLLIIAALVHDIGKNRGGSHSAVGAAMIPEIASRWGLTDEQSKQLELLVLEHLLLSDTSRRRDVSDPRVLRELCAAIKTQENLNLLTCLTFCDMSTVGPDSINDWRATLLLQLHFQLQAILAQGLEQALADQEKTRSRQREALIDATQYTPGFGGTWRAHIESFIQDLPHQHLEHAQLEPLIRQFMAFRDHMERGNTSSVWSETLLDQNVTEVIVLTRDTPGTLAKIAGAMSACSVDILTAEIVSTRRGLVLDIFRITPLHSTSPIKPHRLERVTRTLMDILDGILDVNEALQKRLGETRLAPRPAPTIKTEVRTYQDLSDDYTVIEVHAKDRPGLLYELASALHINGVDTHTAKLDKLGNKAIDTFYVADINGGKLSPKRLEEITEAVVLAIEESPLLDHPATRKTP